VYHAGDSYQSGNGLSQFPVGVGVTQLGSAQKQRGSAIHHVLALVPALYVTGNRYCFWELALGVLVIGTEDSTEREYGKYCTNLNSKWVSQAP
jgi:hypothetical protein